MFKGMKRTLTTAGVAVALALGGTVAVTAAGEPGSLTGPTEAQAVPYKMPVGTWGGTTYYRDVPVRCQGNNQIRYREWNRWWWTGSAWSNRVYQRGNYVSNVRCA